jgi:alkylhydroperoxidase family enzyme
MATLGHLVRPIREPAGRPLVVVVRRRRRIELAERVALEYAAMTDTARDVDDALLARVREHHDEEQIVGLTMLIAWENASSRFNRALRVPSAGLWKPA